MKQVILTTFMSVLAFVNAQETPQSLPDSSNVTNKQSFVLKGVQASEKSGFTFSQLSAAALKQNNLGQDFTYLIGNTPSAVTTSDAGAGIGYTGIRIRGSDATRINVLVNGIPINDAESHGVYWVNMPDLASSTNQVQIQRGVGTSTIGNGAFGANINAQNTLLNPKANASIQQSIGSYGSSKSTFMFGTGLINGFNFGARLSNIVSDGYIDRASSKLQSYQLNANYKSKTFDVQAVAFGGKETTYQSWYGTPESRYNNDTAAMSAYAYRNGLSAADKTNLLNSGRTYNYYTYPNQIDNYRQNHYQLHCLKTFNAQWQLRSSIFTTTGKGYFEEFKAQAPFASYGVSDLVFGTDTIRQSNLVRQRWLDNLYAGHFTHLDYHNKALSVILGSSYTQYHGKHFGQVVWADLAQAFGSKDFEYYKAKSQKNDLNSFLKVNYAWRRFKMDLDLQYRSIHYWSKGTDNELSVVKFDTNYHFFNPKVGASYTINAKQYVYASFSVANREPIRSDFVDHKGAQLPQPENLKDLELGYVFKHRQNLMQFNVYNMQYLNQLVITGALNDVGNALRTNVAKSYRRGIEWVFQKQFKQKFALDANLNLSQNKIQNFEDVYYNYDNYTTIVNHYKQSDIAMSPNVVAYLGLTDKHFKTYEFNVQLKYVGKQFLDNTSTDSRSLKAYKTLNVMLQKTIYMNHNTIVLKAAVNNLANALYANNGYTYKYIYGAQTIVENFYYPQSPRFFNLGVEFKFQ
jgi:iron complex outermembrane receptor protein